jgi:hypothetical protein
MHFAVQTVWSRRLIFRYKLHKKHIFVNKTYTTIYFQFNTNPQKVFTYTYTHHQRNLAAQEKPYTKKNVLETCVNGAMQDTSLGIDAELHQFINKL